VRLLGEILVLGRARVRHVLIGLVHVFGAHLNGSELRFTGSSFSGFFSPIGEWGVDLFFVISGFVMIVSTWNEFATPAISLRFLVRRVTRIYPAYWLVMLPILALFLVRPDMVDGSQTIRPNIAASFLLFPQYGKPLLTVSWTLVYEMFFYLVFAVVLAFDRRWCVPLIGAWCVLTLAGAAVTHDASNPYLRVYAGPMLVEFVFGVLVGFLTKLRGPVFPVASVIVGVAALLAIDVTAPTLMASYGLQTHELRFLWIGIPVALILNGFVGMELRRGWVVPPWLQTIGNASYSLYLWHVPLIILVGRLSAHHVRTLGNPFVHAAWLAGVYVFVFGTSILIYRTVERPMLRFFGHFLRSKMPPPSPLTAFVPPGAESRRAPAPPRPQVPR
jgi:peptidoglycan/LPS O-acetylase OafA/YrhL